MALRPNSLRSANTRSLVGAGLWVVASIAFMAGLHGTSLLVAGALDTFVLLGIVLFVLVGRPRYELRLLGGDLVWAGLRRTRIVFRSGEPGFAISVDVRLRGRLLTQTSALWLLLRGDG
ncbi:MAG: hypothetical protein WA938_08865, partial [Candidatus Dormiibacterota bacterium]